MNDYRTAITEFIFREGRPVACDAIFCAGTSYPQIPELAAQLYAQGLAPVVFVGGRYSITKGRFMGAKARGAEYPGPFDTEAQFYTYVLRKCGVPEHAILAEECSTFTKENAVYARKIALERGVRVKKALLLSQSFHARRCAMYYKLEFPDTEFISVPVCCDGVTKENWYESDYGISRVMGEVRRIGEQFTGEEIMALAKQ